MDYEMMSRVEEEILAAESEYRVTLLTIQVQLDRLSIERTTPTGVDMLTLKHISDLALQASKIR